MKPTVSVCIPTYNGARFLAACLESVVSQTFSDVEILVVDDCSSDETVQIASAFARRDPRIRIMVNEANLGAGGQLESLRPARRRRVDQVRVSG